jgi:hypothetical protein
MGLQIRYKRYPKYGGICWFILDHMVSETQKIKHNVNYILCFQANSVPQFGRNVKVIIVMPN